MVNRSRGLTKMFTKQPTTHPALVGASCKAHLAQSKSWKTRSLSWSLKICDRYTKWKIRLESIGSNAKMVGKKFSQIQINKNVLCCNIISNSIYRFTTKKRIKLLGQGTGLRVERGTVDKRLKYGAAISKNGEQNWENGKLRLLEPKSQSRN